MELNQVCNWRKYPFPIYLDDDPSVDVPLNMRVEQMGVRASQSAWRMAVACFIRRKGKGKGLPEYEGREF